MINQALCQYYTPVPNCSQATQSVGGGGGGGGGGVAWMWLTHVLLITLIYLRLVSANENNSQCIEL